MGIQEKLAGLFSKMRYASTGGRPPGVDWKKKLAAWDSDTLVLRLRAGTRRLHEKGIGFYGRILTTLGCSYFLADALALWISGSIPPPPPTRARFDAPPAAFAPTSDDYNVIVTRNLFNSQGLIPGEKATGGMDDSPPVQTSLPLTLLGTVILQDSSRSLATLQDRSLSLVLPIRVGDEIPGKLKALKIEPRRFIFFNLSNYRKEFVEMPEDSPSPQIVHFTAPVVRSGKGSDDRIKQVSETQFAVEGAAIDQALSNFNLILTQAKAVPNYEGGAPAGFRLTQIVPGSIYSQLGIKENDVLYGFNDEKINDVGKALEALQDLKTARGITIQINRSGKRTNLEYNINR